MKHGTTSGYSKHRCHCDACMTAWREYNRQYMYEWYHGGRRTVDAKECRDHIRFLQSRGWTLSAVAEASRITPLVVRKLASGGAKRIRRTTADRLLSVAATTKPRQCMHSAADAVRLLDELRAAGLRSCDIAGTLKVTAPSRIRRQRHVQPMTWRKLVVAYTYFARQGIVPASLLDEVAA